MKRNYLETQAKRKLLWGGKKVAEKPTELTDQQKLWANLQVGTDKQTNKFQKVRFHLSKSSIGLSAQENLKTIIFRRIYEFIFQFLVDGSFKIQRYRKR